MVYITGMRIPSGSAVSHIFLIFRQNINHKYKLGMPAGGSKIA